MILFIDEIVAMEIGEEDEKERYIEAPERTTVPERTPVEIPDRPRVTPAPTPVKV